MITTAAERLLHSFYFEGCIDIPEVNNVDMRIPPHILFDEPFFSDFYLCVLSYFTF